MIKCSKALGEIIERRKGCFTPSELETLNVTHGKLISLEEAEEQGRLVILPCKVGTPVWSSILCRIGEDIKEYPAQWPFTISMMDEWGTGFFMTKEEAETALKGENKNGT